MHTKNERKTVSTMRTTWRAHATVQLRTYDSRVSVSVIQAVHADANARRDASDSNQPLNPTSDQTTRPLLHHLQRRARHYARECHECQVDVVSQCRSGVAVVRSIHTACSRRSWTWGPSGDRCTAIDADRRSGWGRKRGGGGGRCGRASSTGSIPGRLNGARDKLG